MKVKLNRRLIYSNEFINNLIFLANAADLQSNSRFILRQERELISQKDLSCFDNKFNYAESEKKKEITEKKDKQVKIAWTTQEHEKFIEALKLFGEKSVHKISDHIGTRTVIQVRSHLQKYKLKQMKLSQLNSLVENEGERRNFNLNDKKKN